MLRYSLCKLDFYSTLYRPLWKYIDPPRLIFLLVPHSKSLAPALPPAAENYANSKL